MSAWDVIRQVPGWLPRPAPAARPKLRLVRSPQRRLGTTSFAVAVVVFLVGGMVGLLALNTYVQDQAFVLRSLQQRAAELSYRQSDLEAQVRRANAPAELAGRAAELGMVPTTSSAYIDLASGRVVGDPRPASGSDLPGLKVAPTSLLTVPGEQQVKSTVLPWADIGSVPAPGGG